MQEGRWGDKLLPPCEFHSLDQHPCVLLEGQGEGWDSHGVFFPLRGCSRGPVSISRAIQEGRFISPPSICPLYRFTCIFKKCWEDLINTLPSYLFCRCVSLAPFWIPFSSSPMLSSSPKQRGKGLASNEAFPWWVIWYGEKKSPPLFLPQFFAGFNMHKSNTTSPPPNLMKVFATNIYFPCWDLITGKICWLSCLFSYSEP